MTIDSGQTAKSNEVMNAFGLIFKNQSETWLSNTHPTEANLTNVEFDLMTSDTADEWQHMLYDSGTDLYETRDQSVWSDFYIDIYADSVTVGSLNDNNCVTIQIHKGGTAGNVFRIYCDTGTAAVRKAQVYKTLFYGTDGSDPGIVDHCTSVTAIKSSDATDNGKRVIYTELQLDSSATYSAATNPASYTGTFNDTSTNTGCQFWSYVGVQDATTDVGRAAFEAPDDTELNAIQSNSSNNDETGTDTTGDNIDNPATCDLEINNISGNVGDSGVTDNRVRAIILCKGTISWAEIDPEGIFTPANTDFGATITTISTADLSDNAYVNIQLNATVSSTVTNLISNWNDTTDASNTLVVTMSADGTNYETATENEILRLVNTGTDLNVKFSITRTDATTTDSVTDIHTMYNFY